ncbi:MAG: hypothetical protein KC619_13500 [Myxococcales bacterium]|nr:hypothetical protein [Myxococcales bacterium]
MDCSRFLALALVLASAAAPQTASAQHADVVFVSVRGAGGFVAYPQLGGVDGVFEAVAGANIPIWSVDEPAPREGWGLSIEAGTMLNTGPHIGGAVHGILSVGFDYRFDFLAMGPVASFYVGGGARDLSVGGRLGYRIELLFGILGAEVTLDGRGYGGEALFGLDARAMIDVGALTEIVVALATNG